MSSTVPSDYLLAAARGLESPVSRPCRPTAPPAPSRRGHPLQQTTPALGQRRASRRCPAPELRAVRPRPSAAFLQGDPCARCRHSRCGKQLRSRSVAPAQGPRWKKSKNGKDSAATAAVYPMSSIVAKLQASLRDSKAVAILATHTRDAILEVSTSQAKLLNSQAKLLNCAAFGRAVESAGAADRQCFQLGPEEVFFLCHALKCIRVESENKARIDTPELWDLLVSASEKFPEMYKAYEYLRLKNWVVKSGLQYGADFVAYRHHPALVHSEFAVTVVPEGKAFSTRCGRMKDWPELLCALRASGSVAKTLLVLTISTNSSELGSLDCLEQMTVHERTITRWIPQQCREQQDKPSREVSSNQEQEHTSGGVVFSYCREQQDKPSREETSNQEQEHTSGGVVFSYWGVVLSFAILSSLLVYKLKS